MPHTVTPHSGGICALAVFFSLFLPSSALCGDLTDYLENKLAKEELVLARTPSLYFIVYLKSRVIALKSRGMTLQEWKVKNIRAWGDAPPLGALTLHKKSTLFPPKRKKIKPAATENDAASFELDALELKDMPSRFTLFLSGGIRILVRTRASGFFPRLGNFGHLVSWSLAIPLRNLSLKLRRKPFGAIDIQLEKKEDGQSLFWALPDGIKGLVFAL